MFVTLYYLDCLDLCSLGRLEVFFAASERITQLMKQSDKNDE